MGESTSLRSRRHLFSCSEFPPNHMFSPKVIRSVGKIFFLFKLKCSPFLCSEDICHELLALVVPDALTPVHSYPSVTLSPQEV